MSLYARLYVPVRHLLICPEQDRRDYATVRTPAGTNWRAEMNNLINIQHIAVGSWRKRRREKARVGKAEVNRKTTRKMVDCPVGGGTNLV